MSMTLKEHAYIGKSEACSMESSEKNERKSEVLNLKATELRLGLPGSGSPEREIGPGEGDKNAYPIGMLKGFVSGAKRGFSDTVNGACGKWIFTGSDGSEVGFATGGCLFSPKGVHGHAPVKTAGGAVVKEVPFPPSPKPIDDIKPNVSTLNGHGVASASKAQVVGWPPVRSFRKNSLAISPPKTSEDADAKLGNSCLYVKVSMDGAPYLRKVDLKTYNSYKHLSSALEKMFSCFTIGQYGSHGVHIKDGISVSRLKDLLHGSEYVLTYEDKDGDWMLVGDVPWDMFINSCKRLRIMKSSDAVGLAPRAMEKCRNRCH